MTSRLLYLSLRMWVKGWVETEMGSRLADKLGLPKAPMTLDESVTGIVRLLDESTRATHGGMLWNVASNGSVHQMPW